MSWSDELTIWMSSSAMEKPTHITAKAKTLRPGASSAAPVSIAVSPTPAHAGRRPRGAHRGLLGAGRPRAGGGVLRKAGPRGAEPRAVAVEQDAHRHPLHDAR